MADLITLAHAKRHLRLEPPGADAEQELIEKIAQATAVVLDYVSQRLTDTGSPTWAEEVAAWDAETVPYAIQAAILLQLGDFYRFRGDDAPGDTPKADHGFLAPRVVALLHRYRDPALA